MFDKSHALTTPQRAGLLGSIVERASEALAALHGCPGTCCHGANTLE
jgi:hypothetical protein